MEATMSENWPFYNPWLHPHDGIGLGDDSAMKDEARERHRQEFLRLLEHFDLSHQEVAEMLDVSLDTVKCWLKPQTSKNSNPVPTWAPKLLCYMLVDDENEEGENG
jgi:hypothetical protein